MARAIRAISLAETIFSIALLGLIAVALLNLLPSAMLTVRQSESNERAHSLANDLIERQRSLPFEDLVIAPPTTQTETVEGMEFETTTEIFTVGNDALIKGLRVRVSWPGREGRREVNREIEVARVRR